MKMKSTYEKPSERKKRVQTENIKRIKKWSENDSELNPYQYKIVRHYKNIGKVPFTSATWSVVQPNCHSVKK